MGVEGEEGAEAEVAEVEGVGEEVAGEEGVERAVIEPASGGQLSAVVQPLVSQLVVEDEQLFSQLSHGHGQSDGLAVS